MAKQKTVLARRLRRRQTPHEATMWALLRDRRLQGYKFYRQFVIKGFIVDFCCRSHHLVIELDGGGHANPTQKKYDIARDAVIKQAGYRVVRFWNSELAANRDGVLQYIIDMLNQRVRKD